MEQELCHILHQTEESYVAVYPGVKDKQEGWQVWYAKWLLMFFDLEAIFGYLPTHEQLQFSLLQGEIAFGLSGSKQNWSDFVGEHMYQSLAQKYKA